MPCDLGGSTSGRNIEKVLPCSSSVLTSIQPPHSLTVSRQHQRPRPVFSFEAKKKGSKIWGRSFVEIPHPLSETDMQANRPTRASGWCARSSSVMKTRVAARVIVPLCGVASRALIAKFNNTCSIPRGTQFIQRGWLHGSNLSVLPSTSITEQSNRCFVLSIRS